MAFAPAWGREGGTDIIVADPVEEACSAWLKLQSPRLQRPSSRPEEFGGLGEMQRNGI